MYSSSVADTWCFKSFWVFFKVLPAPACLPFLSELEHAFGFTWHRPVCRPSRRTEWKLLPPPPLCYVKFIFICCSPKNWNPELCRLVRGSRSKTEEKVVRIWGNRRGFHVYPVCSTQSTSEDVDSLPLYFCLLVEIIICTVSVVSLHHL